MSRTESANTPGSAVNYAQANKILILLTNEAFMPRQPQPLECSGSAESGSSGYQASSDKGQKAHQQGESQDQGRRESQHEQRDSQQGQHESQQGQYQKQHRPYQNKKESEQYWNRNDAYKAACDSSPDGPAHRHPPGSWNSGIMCNRSPIEAPPSRYDALGGPKHHSGSNLTSEPGQPSTSESVFCSRHEMTGTNVYELAYIWTVLKEKHPNSPVVIASPRGGPVATDPQSADRLHNDSHLKNKISNTDFYQRLGHTVPVSWICPDEYAAVIAVGGEGALYDLPEHGDVALAISHIYERNKGTVAAIGRGTAALLNVPASSAYASATTESESSLNLKNAECHSDVEGRKYLVEGKRMTCYSRQEEEETGGNLHPTHEGSHHGSKSTIPNAPGEASKGPAAHTRRKEQQNPEGKRSMSNYALPYDLEEELRRRGAKTECAKPFEPNVVVDGRIITAQSYPSMKRFMEEFSKCLS